MLLDVLHELRLDIRLPRNGDGLLHERLVKVHLVQLQLQLLGDLKEQGEKRIRGKRKTDDFSCFNTKLRVSQTVLTNEKQKPRTFGSNVAKNLTKGWNSSAASSYSMKSEWKRRESSKQTYKQTDRRAGVDGLEAPASTYGEISRS